MLSDPLLHTQWIMVENDQIWSSNEGQAHLDPQKVLMVARNLFGGTAPSVVFFIQQ